MLQQFVHKVGKLVILWLPKEFTCPVRSHTNNEKSHNSKHPDGNGRNDHENGTVRTQKPFSNAYLKVHVWEIGYKKILINLHLHVKKGIRVLGTTGAIY